MKILVAGGGGFIGSHIIDRLIDRGYDVHVYDLQRPHKETKKGYKWVDIDITDFTRLEFNMSVEEFDVVYNLASVSNTMECVNDPVKATKVNCLGTINLLEASKLNGVKRFIMASSSLISGLQLLDLDKSINVERSNHIYVTTKLFQEMAVRDFYEMYKLPATILRYGICYGPRMTEGVVVDIFIKQALQGKPITIHGDGSQWRQYVYVEDLADANVSILGNCLSMNQTYNLVGEKVSILDIAHAIQRALPETQIMFMGKRSHDLDVKIMSNKEMTLDFGWTPRTSLEKGIRKTVEYYKERM